MDTQTRHALKGDKFAQATKTSVTWLSGHRTNVMRKLDLHSVADLVRYAVRNNLVQVA